jgi:hypothetical protein
MPQSSQELFRQEQAHTDSVSEGEPNSPSFTPGPGEFMHSLAENGAATALPEVVDAVAALPVVVATATVVIPPVEERAVRATGGGMTPVGKGTSGPKGEGVNRTYELDLYRHILGIAVPHACALLAPLLPKVVAVVEAVVVTLAPGLPPEKAMVEVAVVITAPQELPPGAGVKSATAGSAALLLVIAG